MLKSALITAVASAAIVSFSSAGAAEFCATPDQAAKVQAFYADNPGAMPVIAARRLGLPEAIVVSGLSADQSASAPGSAFDTVWSAMTAWQEATFLIMKGANVFEIRSGIAPGKPSEHSDYYNIAYEQPLRGHLRPDLYASIYAIEMPGENSEETNRGVIVYDQDGASVFGVFFSGDGPDPAPAEIRKFDTVMKVIRSQPSVCDSH